MHEPGRPFFNKERHAKLLQMVIDHPKMNDVELAAYFRCSVPTIIKWKKLPLGYKPAYGRPKREA